MAEKRILVGGQAIIEGVMMRVPGAYAATVRKPDGSIESMREEFTSVTEKSKFWKNPILRGMISLFEAMKIGFKTLQFSADMQISEKEKQAQESTSGKFKNFLATVFSIAFAIGLFIVAPLALTKFVKPDFEQGAVFYNLISGGFRILILLTYLSMISMIKDVRRVFEYHGAEHKTIYAFENGAELTPEKVRNFSRFHPRCGTSFLLIVMIVGIFVFAILDTAVIGHFNKTNLIWRILYHIPFIPFVAGIGYEAIRLTSRFDKYFLIKLLTLPGLWLQRITTREPDDKQIKIAITSLETAFGDKMEKMRGKSFVTDAIG